MKRVVKKHRKNRKHWIVKKWQKLGKNGGKSDENPK